MCRRIQSLQHRGLVYRVTQALKTTYPNIGKWIIPDVAMKKKNGTPNFGQIPSFFSLI